MTKAEILARIVCPACGGSLGTTAEFRRCEACAIDYPVVDGVPVLLGDASEILLERERGGPAPRSSRLKTAYDGLVDAIPGEYTLPDTADNFRFLRGQLPPGAACLAVGGGIAAYGRETALLGDDIMAGMVNLEIAPGPVVDLVADGHHIPFPDETFDLIVCQAVLEHVKRPWRVAQEMRRILRPGGWIFVDVPFIANVHMHSDFWRFTPRGLLELLRDFEPVRTGQSAGLGAAAGLINGELLAAVLSCGSPRAFRRLRRACRKLTGWQSLWDRLLAGTSLPPDAPRSIYFVGRRPEPRPLP